MSLDWNKVNALLGVIHSASAAGPKFTKYASLANDELEALWAAEQPEPAVVTKPVEEVEDAGEEDHEDEDKPPVERRI